MDSINEITVEVEGISFLLDRNVYCPRCGKKGLWKRYLSEELDSRTFHACMSCSHMFKIEFTGMAHHPIDHIITRKLRDAERQADEDGIFDNEEVNVNSPIAALEI